MSRETRKPYANLPVAHVPRPISWPFLPPDDVERNETLAPNEADELDALRERYEKADAHARSRGKLGTQGARVRALSLTPRSEHSHPSAATWCYFGYSKVVPSYHIWYCTTASSASHQAGQGGVEPAPCRATMIVACYRLLRVAWPCSVCQTEEEAAC